MLEASLWVPSFSCHLLKFFRKNFSAGHLTFWVIFHEKFPINLTHCTPGKRCPCQAGQWASGVQSQPISLFSSQGPRALSLVYEPVHEPLGTLPWRSRSVPHGTPLALLGEVSGLSAAQRVPTERTDQSARQDASPSRSLETAPRCTLQARLPGQAALRLTLGVKKWNVTIAQSPLRGC